jgi:hypothetical protein
MKSEAEFWQNYLDREDEEQDAIPVHPVEVAVVIGILVIAGFVGWLLW